MTKKRYSNGETISVELGQNPGDVCATRPFQYLPAEGEGICQRIIQGESLRSLTSGRKSPGRQNLLRWLSESETFRIAYTQACEVRRVDFEREILTTDERNAKSRALGHILDVRIEGAAQARLLVEVKRMMAARVRNDDGVSIR